MHCRRTSRRKCRQYVFVLWRAKILVLWALSTPQVSTVRRFRAPASEKCCTVGTYGVPKRRHCNDFVLQRSKIVCCLHFRAPQYNVFVLWRSKGAVLSALFAPQASTEQCLRAPESEKCCTVGTLRAASVDSATFSCSRKQKMVHCLNFGRPKFRQCGVFVL